jgi:hypothetical protein
MNKSVRSVKKPDIFSHIIPIYYLSKFTGLAPLSLAYTQDELGRVEVTLKTSVFGILHTVLTIMGIIGAQCCVLYFSDKLSIQGERKKNVVNIEYLINGFSGITCLAMSLIRIRKQMDEVLYQIYVVDKTLNTKFDILRINEKHLRVQVISLISIVFIVYTNDGLFPTFDYSVWIIYVCTSIKIVTIIQFVNLVSLLRQKFKILNSYLAPAEKKNQRRNDKNLWEMLLQTPCFGNEDNWKNDALQIDAFYQALNMRHQSNITMQHSTNISIQNSWLRKEKLRCRALRIIWDVLCDVSSSVNSMYGLQILLCIVSAFIEITTNLSYSIVELKLNVRTNVKHYHEVVNPAIWALMQFLLMFWIAASCSAACGEANRSITLLQKLLLLPELHPATAAEMKLFLQQTRDRKPKFTAWDFFTITYSVLGSIVGAIITLLVILVQMQAN